MKNILCCISFLCLAHFTFAQNIPTDTSAPVVAYWRPGDKKTVSITRTVEKSRAGQRVSFAVNTCEALITVKDSAKEGYTLEWKYTQLGKSEKILQFVPELHNLLKNLVIVYKTDDVGNFDRLLNYDEVRKMVDVSFASFTKMANDSSAAFRSAVKEMAAIFQSRESIEQLVLKDISLFHTPYGIEYTSRKQEQEVELVNFLGGDPWPAVQSFQLTSLKPGEDLAGITISQTIHEEKAAAILKAFISRIAERSGKQIKPGEFPSSISIKDHHEFDIRLSSGWVKRAYQQRMVQTDEQKKTDTMEIILY